MERMIKYYTKNKKGFSLEDLTEAMFRKHKTFGFYGYKDWGKTKYLCRFELGFEQKAVGKLFSATVYIDDIIARERYIRNNFQITGRWKWEIIEAMKNVMNANGFKPGNESRFTAPKKEGKLDLELPRDEKPKRTANQTIVINRYKGKTLITEPQIDKFVEVTRGLENEDRRKATVVFFENLPEVGDENFIYDTIEDMIKYFKRFADDWKIGFPSTLEGRIEYIDENNRKQSFPFVQELFTVNGFKNFKRIVLREQGKTNKNVKILIRSINLDGDLRNHFVEDKNGNYQLKK